MKVKDLIIQLLTCDMDKDVLIEIKKEDFFAKGKGQKVFEVGDKVFVTTEGE